MKSCWLKDSSKKNYPLLKEICNTDILIVGGGISGISLAYELKNTPYKITLLEQNELYHATTGYTTGKVTFQHGFIYHKLIKKFGKNKAKMYYEANFQAMNHLFQTIQQNKIDCDLFFCSNYLYSQNQHQYRQEKKAYDTLNIPYEKATCFNTEALKVSHQATFHVIKYLDGLLRILDKFPNVEIYEHSKVLKTKSLKDKAIAYGENFEIHAKIVIFACAYPFYKSFNFYFLRLKPVISYVVESEVKPCVTNSVMDGSRSIFSFRPYQYNQALFSGASMDSRALKSLHPLEKLKEKITQHFKDVKIENIWSNQDYQTLDELPFIGKIRPNVYITTGYNKWGISNSILASLLIKDLIVKNDSKYELLFSPKRYIGVFPYLKYGIQNVYTLIESKFLYSHSISTCRHLHCSLRKNEIDGTWDCPCHGTRYDENGQVIIGPSKKNISKSKK